MPQVQTGTSGLVLPLQEYPRHMMNCCAFIGACSLRVQVHRRRNIRVPQEFLLDGHVSSRIVQDRREGMAEGVPANLANFGTRRSGLNVVCEHYALPAPFAAAPSD